MLIIAWGSTYGSVKSAITQCQDEGIPVAYLHLRHLNPLPTDLPDLMKSYKKVFVAELNTGHLCQLIRSNYLVDAQSIQQCNGLPFNASTLVKRIKMEIEHEC